MKVGDTVLVSNPVGALAEVWLGHTGIVEATGNDNFPLTEYPINKADDMVMTHNPFTK